MVMQGSTTNIVVYDRRRQRVRCAQAPPVRSTIETREGEKASSKRALHAARHPGNSKPLFHRVITQMEQTNQQTCEE